MKHFGCRTFAVVGIAALLSACGTTTDLVESVTNSITNVTESTTPSDKNKSAFIKDRFDAIRFEAAKGEGENIDTLAAMLGETNRQEFARWMQNHYASLFGDL